MYNIAMIFIKDFIFYFIITGLGYFIIKSIVEDIRRER